MSNLTLNITLDISNEKKMICANVHATCEGNTRQLIQMREITEKEMEEAGQGLANLLEDIIMDEMEKYSEYKNTGS